MLVEVVADVLLCTASAVSSEDEHPASATTAAASGRTTVTRRIAKILCSTNR
jgi:hypothetical protein